jgi:hypothetical protein
MSPLRKSDESPPAVTTPQMMILGMNCNDEVNVQSRSSQREQPAAMAVLSSSSWLSRIISSSSSVAALLPASNTSPRPDNRDDNGEPRPEHHAGMVHGYSAMGDADSSPQRRQQKTRRHRLSPPDITSDMVYAALGPQQSSPSFANSSASILLGNNTSSAAAVDDHRQYGHHGHHDNFFFRSTDDSVASATTISPRRRSAFNDETNNNNHHGIIWKTLRRNTRHAELFEYSDAVETLPAPVLQRYRTRYAQLNQEIVLPERDDEDYNNNNNGGVLAHQWHSGNNNNMVDHDLQLRLHHDDDDDAGAVGPAFNTIAQSNLVYEADGKRLMRLPRDRVRLLMDPDLEPGILSVEGPSRCYHPDTNNNNDHCDDNNNNNNNNSSTDQQHSIGYVLTVHEDLYRKIVMEMSPRYLQYDAKLDIRFAYLALAIVMIVLLINTVAVHEL